MLKSLSTIKSGVIFKNQDFYKQKLSIFAIISLLCYDGFNCSKERRGYEYKQVNEPVPH